MLIKIIEQYIEIFNILKIVHLGEIRHHDLLF
jgi:hypothetical protein